MNSNSQTELAVDMRSPCCADKVKKALQEITGVSNVQVDLARQTIIVEGDVIAERLKNTIEKKTGMYAAVMGLGSSKKQNLGAAVAALDVSDSTVKGVLRMNQTDPDTCVIEGSLDGLPCSKDLFVYIHETGDLSDGCNSCGPSFGHEKSDNVGLISHLKREDDGSANFRCSSLKLNVYEMYGRCIVIHEGDEQQIKNAQSKRLACGIVARSSGMFENSKRFCACDGVTIWEEKKRSSQN